jgi:AcrR family transcriptional regulator
VKTKSKPGKSKPGKSKPKPARPARSDYHHGNLRQALIDAALELLAEGGEDAVKVREAARRAGVSAGAPFRHFPTRTALMTAVAEESMRRFKAEIDRAVARTSARDPLERLRAIARAYLLWAMRNPAHFEIHSTQRLFDFDRATHLHADDNAIRAVTRQTVQDAADAGLLRQNDVALVQLAGRAMVYGFARMKIDGHFARWNVPEADAERIGDAVVDLFIAGIAKA